MVSGGDLEEYAAVIANRGIVVITFDFRNLGHSDGQPRQEIDPHKQLEDFRCAISYARSCPEIDPQRIGLWGTSYSGGHALVLAATDKRLKCVVSQVPTISGYQAGLRRADYERAQIFQQRLIEDREARFRGGNPGTIQTTSADPHAAVAYPQRDSYEYMTSEGSRCPTWRNEVTLRSLELARQYEPGTFVKRIGTTPLLMIIADKDGLTPTDLQQDAFNALHHPKKLMIIDGGHYSVYQEHFEATSAAAAEWFERHLVK
jgi:fermentation-respiration switch protein FrsA (DUF1100 family)